MWIDAIGQPSIAIPSPAIKPGRVLYKGISSRGAVALSVLGSAHTAASQSRSISKEEWVATFKGEEFFCYDLSQSPIQSSADEITLAFRTAQRSGLMLHTGKSADYANLSLKGGAVWLVINLGSGAFEALVEPASGKFNDNAWHNVRVTRNLRQNGPGSLVVMAAAVGWGLIDRRG
ncbi:hypothetical protein AAFF_G00297830 [Aldrovandia affinis]|uniref:Laminin G domain-containing protein n=1 Tax=Aldrovandia affinis TaxID=143900 RepID=A0AAD7W1D4_9TELE|nr:hypothetical protein AAFF_G00297830 [Aldrovandia affinis]